jgi:hypothetical protein
MSFFGGLFGGGAKPAPQQAPQPAAAAPAPAPAAAFNPGAALRTLQNAIDTGEKQILASELKIGAYAEKAKACMARQPPDQKGAFVCDV